ncbi:MAG: hypothetical protein F4Z67_03240, partial [Synechococcus sp. SB0667_bin_8]|nr:hypothetical protein [Synechococcus sp. SB0667_bin_8]
MKLETKPPPPCLPMPADDVRKPPQRYRQRIRVVAAVVSGAFALPVLFVFGVTLRELSRPPEPSIYAAPPAPPQPPPGPPQWLFNKYPPTRPAAMGVGGVGGE